MGTGKFLKSLACTLLLCLAPAVAAQDYDYRGEVFGSIAGAKIWHDEGSLGQGVNYGGGLGFRLNRTYGFELEVNGMNASFGSPDFRGRPLYITGNILHHFSTSRVQPYVLFGLGVLHYRGRLLARTFPDPFDPTVFEEVTLENTVTGFAWNAGVGFKAFLNRHWSLRPEFRYFSGRPAFEPAIPEPPITVPRVSIALSYHW